VDGGMLQMGPMAGSHLTSDDWRSALNPPAPARPGRPRGSGVNTAATGSQRCHPLRSGGTPAAARAARDRGRDTGPRVRPRPAVRRPLHGADGAGGRVVLTDPLLTPRVGPLRRGCTARRARGAGRPRPALAPARRPHPPAVAADARRRPRGRPARRRRWLRRRGRPPRRRDSARGRSSCTTACASPGGGRAQRAPLGAAFHARPAGGGRWATSWRAAGSWSTSPGTPTCSTAWPPCRARTSRCCRCGGGGPSLGPGHLDPARAAQAVERIRPRTVVRCTGARWPRQSGARARPGRARGCATGSSPRRGVRRRRRPDRRVALTEPRDEVEL
jgi:hypothetical protein